jgi:peptidoglycan/LPS O-acetylase OafA/YrhL
MHEKKVNQIASLTGVRGLAALWVAFLHGRGSVPLDQAAFGVFGNFLGRGWLGVDLFFILSGFIISYVHGADFPPLSWPGIRRFLTLRLARIYPAHAVATLILVPMLLIATTALGYQPKTDTFSMLRLGYSLALLNGWGIPGSIGWNVPSWSVSSEWFAYLLFPLIAITVGRVRSRGLNGAIAAGTCLAMIALAIWRTGATQYMPGERLTLLRVSSEFLIGCCLLGIYRSSAPRRIYDWLAFGATAAVIGLALVRPGHFWDFLFIGLFAVTILALSLASGPASAVFGHPILLYLGRISYSLYLMHTIVLTVIHQLSVRFHVGGGPLSVGAAWVIYLAGSIGAAHLLYATVEEPARVAVRRRLDRADVRSEARIRA